MRHLFCIPTYNEADNIEFFMEELFSNLRPHSHVLVIDDNSPDGTALIVEKLKEKKDCFKERLHILKRPGKLGLASAYIDAFKWGLEKGANWFVQMDADFSHQPSYLKDFYREINSKKCDFVCGSRYIEGGGVSNWNPLRVLLSKGGSLYTRIWLRHSLSDWTGGFNAWSSRVIRENLRSPFYSDGYTFQIEMKFRALEKSFRLKEIPIIFQERRAGQSKMGGKIVAEALYKVAWLKYNSY